MAEEHRRVAASDAGSARALAENLVNQGYVIISATDRQWVARRRRRRGDVVVTIDIARPTPPSSWGPPTGAPAH